MLRFAVDPKTLIPSEYFGAADLRFYSELNILGWTNYPGFYKLRERRIPVDVGFNVPAFKILDVASLEVEWFGSRYPNSLERVIRGEVPEPKQLFTEADKTRYKMDALKWSVYLKRNVIDGFSVVGQVANDHMRTYCAREEDLDYEEALRDSESWYWVAKLLYSF
jgi:hypothetical protein